MIRERLGHGKNLLHRMLSMMLVFALAAASVLGTGRGIRAAGDGTVIYLDGVSGDNSRDGKSEEEAVATFSKAKKLAGDKGTIKVCGTVTVSDSQSWSLGSGVRLKRAHGFTDAIAHVTGSLKLSGISLYNTDISGSGSVSGLAGRSPAADIAVPATVTLVQPKALSEVSLADQCFGTGSFAWADGSFVPDKYETQAQIIFTPSDTDVHDYSGLKGWNGDSQTVVRKVKVLTQSFLEEEKKEDGSGSGEEEEPGGKAEDTEEDKKEEASDTDKEQPDGEKEDAGQDKPDGEDNSQGSQDGENKNPDEGSSKEDGGTEDGSGKEDPQPEEKPDADSSGETAGPDNSDAAQEDSQDPEEDGSGEDSADIQNPGEESGEKNPAEGEAGGDVPAHGQDPEDGDDGESPAEDPEGGKSDEPSGEEDKKDESTETWNVEKVEQLLAKLPEAIGSQSDVDAVVAASQAYEQLGEEAQAAVSGELLERLYDAQSRVLAYNRVSLGVTVQGDLPWYIQFRASIAQGRKIDDSTIRTLLESYDFELWNLVTGKEYKLNGKTVTVRMAAPAVKDVDIVIYHYLEDGTVEQIIPEIEGDQMSFVTSSFSPFSVIGVHVAGSTELVGSTGFSYVGKKPGTGSNAADKNSTGSNSGSTSTGSSGNRVTGGGSSSTQSSSTGQKRTSSTTKSNTGVRRATSVGTGDSNNLLGYAMIGSGAVVLMLFAAYMVYVQYKRKSYSRRS